MAHTFALNHGRASPRGPAAHGPVARSGALHESSRVAAIDAIRAHPRLSVGLAPQGRPRSLWLVVAAVHVLGAWALLHSLHAPVAAAKNAAVQIRLIAPAQPPAQQRQRLAASPRIAPAPPEPLIEPPKVQVSAAAVAAHSARVVPAPVLAASAPVAAQAAVTASPDGIRQVPPGAVRYLAAPRLVMPRMSRRLGESGTVLLHIVVDADGQLSSAAVKKSSGYERLDSQALMDIRSARFSPYLEQGQPRPWEADAGLQYEIVGR